MTILKNTRVTNIGENMWKQETSFIAGGNIKWDSSENRKFLKELIINFPYSLTIFHFYLSTLLFEDKQKNVSTQRLA